MLGFKDLINKINKYTVLGDKEFEQILKELQRLLLRTDVSFSVVKDLTQKIKDRKKEKIEGFSKKQQVITIIYEEITKIMGVGTDFEITKKPFKIMLIGLFGSGKTTTTAKIGYFFKKKGRKTILVGLDNYRAAAFEQLKQNGEKTGQIVLGESELKNPVKLWKSNEKIIKKNDLVIIDTAGRDSVNKKYLKEIKDISKIVKPDKTLLVIPAELGQSSEKLTKDFNKVIKIDGIIITKTDTTAKAGGALTSSYLTKKPIFFITEGEKMSELNKFNPERYVSKLLGFGDLKTLLEKAEEVQGKDSIEDVSKRMMKGELTYVDFLQQLESMNKMGGFKKIFGMLPGMSGLGKIDSSQIAGGEKKLKIFKTIIQSMSVKEKESPKTINNSRVERLAKGSGRTVKDVRDLIKNFNRMKKMSKGMNPKNMGKLAKQFGMKM